MVQVTQIMLYVLFENNVTSHCFDGLWYSDTEVTFIDELRLKSFVIISNILIFFRFISAFAYYGIVLLATEMFQTGIDACHPSGILDFFFFSSLNCKCKLCDLHLIVEPLLGASKAEAEFVLLLKNSFNFTCVLRVLQTR